MTEDFQLTQPLVCVFRLFLCFANRTIFFLLGCTYFTAFMYSAAAFSKV